MYLCSAYHRDHPLKAKSRHPRGPLRPLLRQNQVLPGLLPENIEFRVRNTRRLRTSSLPSSMKPAPRKSSTDIPFNLLNRKELAIQLSTRTPHVLAPSLLDLPIFIFVRFRHLGRGLGLSLVSLSFFELLFRLLVLTTSLDRLLELAACREFSCRFRGLFAHHEHRKADRWRRNFEVIGGRLTRAHPCHQHQYPRVAHQ